jgi:hypothetical protein
MTPMRAGTGTEHSPTVCNTSIRHGALKDPRRPR